MHDTSDTESSRKRVSRFSNCPSLYDDMLVIVMEAMCRCVVNTARASGDYFQNVGDHHSQVMTRAHVIKTSEISKKSFSKTLIFVQSSSITCFIPARARYRFIPLPQQHLKNRVGVHSCPRRKECMSRKCRWSIFSVPVFCSSTMANLHWRSQSAYYCQRPLSISLSVVQTCTSRTAR